MIFDYERVCSFLPHRDPFLFIDSVSEIDCPAQAPKEMKDLVGTKVTAHYRTKATHEIFKGHFPGNPILPGVVQVEMMAQASSFIMDKIYDCLEDLKMEVALVSVDGAKFRKPIIPEMDLVIKTTLTKVRGPMLSSDCEIYYDGQLMAQASVMASVRMA